MLNETQINRINYLNIAAMLGAACLAFIIPFELVLLSYAILGPAHYLTEISWLNARQFFTLKKYDYLLIAAVVVLALLLKFPAANLIYYTFGLSLILIVVRGSISRMLAFIVLIIAGYFLLTNNLLRTILGLYVPTLIHVYLFTGAFILFGALKDKIVSGYLSFVFFLLCPVLLCVLFTSYHNAPAAWAVNNYDSFKKLITVALRSPSINVYTSPAAIMLTRLIAFAYTYHYLNWFTKTRVIKWHRVSIARAVILGVIWVASVALYFYNYRLGIKWLFLLSLVHVILEFPLNHKSFIGIGKEIKLRFNGIE